MGLTTNHNSDILKRLDKIIKAALSGKLVQRTIEDNINNDSFPSSPLPNIKTHDVVYSIMEASPTGLDYTDLTSSFLYKSSRGNKYIFVGFHYGTNAILVKPINNRNDATLTAAWKKINARLAKSGVQTHTYIMNSEISK